MKTLIVIVTIIAILCTAVWVFVPTAKDKIPFLKKDEKQVTTQTNEFMQIDGETFNPRNSNIIQMLVARKTASFDGRKWHQELTSNQPNLRGIRIMPAGNTMANWQEAIDFTQFSDPKFDSVTTFATAHKKEVLAKHPNATWRTIKQDSSGIIYDWTVIADKQLGDYTEVGKIMTNDTGVFHVYYVYKRTANVAKTRATFLNFVDNL